LTYHQLGMLSLKRLDLDVAAKWAKKSADICRQIGDAEGLCKSNCVLGTVARAQGGQLEAEIFFDEASEIATRTGDRQLAMTVRMFRNGPGLLTPVVGWFQSLR
jgi:hypothetical protein